MTALRLRTVASSGPVAVPPPPTGRSRPTGLLSILDLPALAAAGTPPGPARFPQYDDSERTVLAPFAATNDAVQAASGAPEPPAPADAPVASRTAARLPASTRYEPVAPSPRRQGAPVKAFGSTTLSRRRDVLGRPTAGSGSPGLGVAWAPGAQVPAGSDGFVNPLGPTVSRLTAVADEAPGTRTDAPWRPEGVLPDAAFLALAQVSPGATTDPTAASAPARPVPGAIPGRTAPSAASPRITPAISRAEGRLAAPRVHPERATPSNATWTPPIASEAPSSRTAKSRSTSPAVVARVPRSAGSLTLSVPVPMAHPGAALGRGFARSPDDSPARFGPRVPSAGPLASWLAMPPTIPGATLTGGLPRSGVLDLGDEERALLQVAGARRPVEAAAGRHAGRAGRTPVAGPAPVLSERLTGVAGAAPRSPFDAAAAPSTAPQTARPASRGPDSPPSPFGPRTEAAFGPADLATAILAPMGSALAHASSDERLRATVRSVDPFASEPPLRDFEGTWSLPEGEATLLALPPPGESLAGTATAAASPNPAARRRNGRPSVAGTPTPPPPAAAATSARQVAAPAPDRIRTATPVSRRSVPLSLVARAGTRAADLPISRTGLGFRPPSSRRPPSEAPSRTGFGDVRDRSLVATPAVTERNFPPPPDALSAGRRASLFVPASAAATRGIAAERAADSLPPSRPAGVASGAAPGTIPTSTDLGLPEGFDFISLRSPLVPAFERGTLAPAGSSAEALASLSRTLVRSLGALAPSRPGSEGLSASAPPSLGTAPTSGTGELVEWIRLLGGGRASPAPGDAPGAEHGALPSMSRDRSEDFAFVDVGPGRPTGPVRPETLRGSLPGLPEEAPSKPVLYDVSMTDRGFVSPGAFSSAFSALGGGAAPAVAGPSYHGSFPLVSTALSSVAATALTAAKADESTTPAKAPDSSDADPQGGQAVDLDGLAAEMSERILRRLKRDKERRGFYG